MECKVNKRQADCANYDTINALDKDIDKLNQSVSKLEGQVVIFKWLLGILILLIISLGSTIFLRNERIREDVIELKLKLEYLEKEFDENKRVNIWTQNFLKYKMGYNEKDMRVLKGSGK